MTKKRKILSINRILLIILILNYEHNFLSFIRSFLCVNPYLLKGEKSEVKDKTTMVNVRNVFYVFSERSYNSSGGEDTKMEAIAPKISFTIINIHNSNDLQ